MISIVPTCAVSGALGSIFFGVSTLISTSGLPSSLILPVPGVSVSGKSLLGTFPVPSFPIVTMIGFPSFPGISTFVPGGYVVPSGFFGVTVTSPVFGSWSNCNVGTFLAGVVISTGCDGFLFGSVMIAVPGTSLSGKSLFRTVPEPFSPIVTSIVFPSLPGIVTLVPVGYVVPSGFLGVTVTSPVLGFWVNSTVGVLRAGVVTSTGFDGSLFGSVTAPWPISASFGRLSFGTVPDPFSPIVTTIVVPFSPGISTFVSLG